LYIVFVLLSWLLRISFLSSLYKPEPYHIATELIPVAVLDVVTVTALFLIGVGTDGLSKKLRKRYVVGENEDCYFMIGMKNDYRVRDMGGIA